MSTEDFAVEEIEAKRGEMTCPDPTGGRSRMKTPAPVCCTLTGLVAPGCHGGWGGIGSLGRGLGDALAIINAQSVLISAFLK